MEPRLEVPDREDVGVFIGDIGVVVLRVESFHTLHGLVRR